MNNMLMRRLMNKRNPFPHVRPRFHFKKKIHLHIGQLTHQVWFDQSLWCSFFRNTIFSRLSLVSIMTDRIYQSPVGKRTLESGTLQPKQPQKYDQKPLRGNERRGQAASSSTQTSSVRPLMVRSDQNSLREKPKVKRVVASKPSLTPTPTQYRHSPDIDQHDLSLSLSDEDDEDYDYENDAREMQQYIASGFLQRDDVESDQAKLIFQKYFQRR